MIQIPLLVVLQQLTPLHWSSEPVLPGETWNKNNQLNIGKVWFNVTVTVWDKNLVPTEVGVAAGITAWSVGIVATSVLVAASGPLGGTVLFGLAKFNSGRNLVPMYHSEIPGARKYSVYADGKTLTVIRTTEGGRSCLAFKEDTSINSSSATMSSTTMSSTMSGSSESTSSSTIVSRS
jgi:hypothetical protein